MTEQCPLFDGFTFDAEMDYERLSTALGKVWDLMRDGRARTLTEIADAVGCSEAGASARLRDLRKAKFTALLPTEKVHSIRDDGGLWFYRIEVPLRYRP